MIAERPAPAKVNLFLHVGPPQADGFHPLASWAVFADLGDRLTLTPAPAWTFEVEGPFATAIEPGENLVETAVRALAARLGADLPAVKLTLQKRLPVAAGLGGGTSDAAAALRLVNAALPREAPEALLEAVAAEVGSDGPACLRAAPVIMQGRGEQLSGAPRTPPLPAVLINPRVPTPTGRVYAAYDAGPAAEADLPELPGVFDSIGAVAAALAGCRNDLQAAAVSLAPAVGEALALARSAPETLLARMSGSGATVFALCADEGRARSLALRLSGARPDWWIVAARLTG